MISLLIINNSFYYPNIIHTDNLKLNIYYLDYNKIITLSGVLLSLSYTTRLTSLLLSNAFSRLLGKYSFSIYLVHMPIIYAFTHINASMIGGDYIKISLIFITIMLVSALSYAIIEAPTRHGLKISLESIFMKQWRNNSIHLKHSD